MMFAPMEKKLTAALAHMPAAQQKATKAVLTHIHALNQLSAGAMKLMAGVKASQHGTKKEKTVAIMKMMVGMAEIQKKMKVEMAALKPHKGADGGHLSAHEDEASPAHARPTD